MATPPRPDALAELADRGRWLRFEHSIISRIDLDAHEILRDYRGAVQDLDDHDRNQIAFFARVTGKDVLKCLRRIVLLNGGAYEASIEAIYRQIVDRAPQQAPLADKLIELYRNPHVSKRVLLDVLEQATVSIASWQA